MQSPFDAYVGTIEDSVPMYADATDTRKPVKYLLWGDGVKLLDAGPTNGRRNLIARDRKGWVNDRHLKGKPLLEVYFIDVGQGDGVLVRTPDFRHILIDGGYPRTGQPSGKSAADFVDWKFARDYRVDTIALDALIASHNDHDHFGGLADLLDVAQSTELDAKRVTVERFCHAGISWWKGERGRTLGTPVRAADGKLYIDQLLSDRASAEAALGAGNGPQLQGVWGDFIEKMLATETAAGTPTPFARLSQVTGRLPGFDAESDAVQVRVLGPVESKIDGRAALRDFGPDSLTTNGHSVLLRVDCGQVRILLTGDLNKVAQQDLLAHYEGHEDEFACDVAKCCHHGSEDVSFTFLQAMKPGATVISSGDAEGHDHPRPRIVAASGVTGHVTFKNDQLLTPLVYSTEIARSLLLGEVTSVDLAGGTSIAQADLNGATVHCLVRKPGNLKPSAASRRLGGSFIVAGLVYGLVNVRTDGRTILCATLNEGDATWTTKTFTSRFF